VLRSPFAQCIFFGLFSAHPIQSKRKKQEKRIKLIAGYCYAVKNKWNRNQFLMRGNPKKIKKNGSVQKEMAVVLLPFILLPINHSTS